MDFFIDTSNDVLGGNTNKLFDYKPVFNDYVKDIPRKYFVAWRKNNISFKIYKES